MATQSIRQTFLENLQDIVYKQYGMKVTSSSNMSGYVDFNIWVDVSDDIDNPHIQKRHVDGYVVKLINQNDSKSPELIDARAQLMIFVKNAGITTPLPVKSITGNRVSTVSLTTQDGMAIRRLMIVLTYIRGTSMSDLSMSPDNFRDIGKLAGKLDLCMEGFPNSEDLEYKTNWKMTECVELLNLIHYAPNAAWREIAKDVLNDFKEKVVPYMNKLQKGLIHHDIGPQNIVMKKDDHSDTWNVAGILDFGDVCPSFYVFEVAILISHIFMTLSSVSSLNTSDIYLIANIIMDAYTSYKSLNEAEVAVLDICVQTRLVQCCLLGEQTKQFDPENGYLNSCICWDLLEKIRELFSAR